jgi:hypothetical protein
MVWLTGFDNANEHNAKATATISGNQCADRQQEKRNCKNEDCVLGISHRWTCFVRWHRVVEQLLKRNDSQDQADYEADRSREN